MASVQKVLSDTNLREKIQRLLDACGFLIPTLSTGKYEIKLGKGYDVKGYDTKDGYIGSCVVYCGKTKTVPPTSFRIFEGTRAFPMLEGDILEVDIFGYSVEGRVPEITKALKNRGYKTRPVTVEDFVAEKESLGILVMSGLHPYGENKGITMGLEGDIWSREAYEVLRLIKSKLKKIEYVEPPSQK